jgi:eukaryotic-like serine/threonine-protein kinase
VERFSRDITIAAALTHPHILPLHDSGEGGGFLYYVMPYREVAALFPDWAPEDRLALRTSLRPTP